MGECTVLGKRKEHISWIWRWKNALWFMCCLFCWSSYYCISFNFEPTYELSYECLRVLSEMLICLFVAIQFL